MQIQEIYEELKEGHLCKSGYAFSRDYMSKDRSYYSVLKARGQEPSIEAWVMLNYALQQRGQLLRDSKSRVVLEAAERLNTLQAKVSLFICHKCGIDIQ